MSLRDLRAVRDVDPLTVSCPVCSAEVGSPCTSTLTNDFGAVKRFPHAMRKRKAVRGVEWGQVTASFRCGTCGGLKAEIAGGSDSTLCSCRPSATVTIRESDSPTGGDVA